MAYSKDDLYTDRPPVVHTETLLRYLVWEFVEGACHAGDIRDTCQLEPFALALADDLRKHDGELIENPGSDAREDHSKDSSRSGDPDFPKEFINDPFYFGDYCELLDGLDLDEVRESGTEESDSGIQDNNDVIVGKESTREHQDSHNSTDDNESWGDVGNDDNGNLVLYRGGLRIVIQNCSECKDCISIQSERHKRPATQKDYVISIKTLSQTIKDSMTMDGHSNPAFEGSKSGENTDDNVSTDSSVFFEETWEEETTVYINPNDRTPHATDADNEKCGLVSVICKCFNKNKMAENPSENFCAQRYSASPGSVGSKVEVMESRRPLSLTGHLDRSSLRDYAGDFCRGCRTRIFPNMNTDHAVKGKFIENDDDVVIVSALRTPICKARRGGFKDTLPDDLLSAVFSATVNSLDIDPSIIQDISVGNVLQPGAGANISRIAQFLSELPDSVPISSVNRMCSSGLQACANIAASIKAGYIDVGMAAGVESMTVNPMNSLPVGMVFNPKLLQNDKARQVLYGMGISSENVSEKSGISREMLDEVAYASHCKAYDAQLQGNFDDEIIPVYTKLIDSEGKETTVVISKDDGIRDSITMDVLSDLKPAFKEGGSTTAGNSSQVSDGAAAVLMCRRSAARRLDLPVLGVFRSFAVVGVAPNMLGTGSARAIPRALEKAGLSTADVDVFEINEAFASEVCYCTKHLGIPLDRVNPNGGAIALGHPLGCTGVRQMVTLLHELRRRGKHSNGVVAMSVGTGMGAAAVLEVPGRS